MNWQGKTLDFVIVEMKYSGSIDRQAYNSWSHPWKRSLSSFTPVEINPRSSGFCLKIIQLPVWGPGRIFLRDCGQNHYSKTKFHIEPKSDPIPGGDHPWKRMRTSSSGLQVLPRGQLDQQVLEGAHHVHGGHSLPVWEVLVWSCWSSPAII